MSENKLVEAHIFALERKERNGKWKVKGIEVHSDRINDADDPQYNRLKYLISGKGESFDLASDDAWSRFKVDPSCRPYILFMIRAI